MIIYHIGSYILFPIQNWLNLHLQYIIQVNAKKMVYESQKDMSQLAVFLYLYLIPLT